MPSRPDIIEQLRRAIEKSDESERAIALATGIDQPHLNRFVHGQRSLSLETAARLCQYLKLELVPRDRR